MKLGTFWTTIRWKILILFSLSSVVSVIMVTGFSIAVLNVIIRRESAYLIEERIKVIVESRKGLMDPVLEKVQGCRYASDLPPFAAFTEQLNATWPGSESMVSILSPEARHNANPRWLDATSFAGLVEDRGSAEIRFLRTVKREGCSVRVLVRIPLGGMFLNQLSKASGLEIVDSRPVLLRPYRRDEGIAGEIKANFIPGSSQPVPVVIVARNWETGASESWVICQLRPSYARTIEDLSRMGLRRASWVAPLITIGFGLGSLYACGMWFSLRLSRRIVTVINTLTHAAHVVGMGDFSISIPIIEHDQLGSLVGSFNAMTSQLAGLYKQENHRITLERDMTLAREAQQYLYPRAAPVLSGATVWGSTTAARIVSGDLYDFFSCSSSSVGLLCADVSGKGMSAALMMAHLQAVTHGRMLTPDESYARPSPSAFAAALNRDLCGRFGDNRYVTMFYGEYNSHSARLRYINAGHCRPIFISETGEVTALLHGDLPIGLFPDAIYQEFQVTVSKGCTVVVYSDGLIDALNAEGEEFGEERLVERCRSLPKGATAKEICSLLSQCLAVWSAGAEQFDDTTILVLTVTDGQISVN
ncbi:SpoIIE family protein phosphatase [Tunturiibacter empetritectus]|uniref:Serine phosphatase RsbU (Regulator of sigma subunit) n=1 Tax=Tunturiibacter lichenicola TaxID=2051959 RepID=A0A852V4M3_9BACT|nr:SpoIIE family protein phosphatase [Edaphobacter lichenicola]NYF87998.1 serine phosphatase RsbU (regulator of sigma subunit) [Edaphobacter lichenicola]